jgi:hypothetical protein
MLGADAAVINFLGITNATGVEVYRGNEFFALLPLRILDGQSSTTISSDLLTGNNIHFRLVFENSYSDFYHIAYDRSENFILSIYDHVVCGNLKKNTQGGLIDGANTYDDLNKFKNEFLRHFNYGELRGTKL